MDLSAKKVKRLEGRNQPNFDFEGKNFVLPYEVPLQVSIIGQRLTKMKGTEAQKDAAMGRGLVNIGHILLRDQWDIFTELGGSAADVMELLDSMDEIYAEANPEEEPDAKMESGESSASE